MRVLLSLILLPLLALVAGIGLVMGERELSAADQAAAVGSELTLEGRSYAPIEVLGGAGSQKLLLEMPLDVSVNQIIRPAELSLRDLTTGQSGRRVIEVKVPEALPNVVLLVPLEGISTAADVSLITQNALNPGPLKDLGFGLLSASEVQRAAMVAVVTLAALLLLWLPVSVSGSLLRRRGRKLQEDVEEERIRAARAQKEAKAAANRADERVAEIEAHAHTREEEARDAIATAARAESNGGGGEEGAFWREAVRDFLLAGNVGRAEVERMLNAISTKVKDKAPIQKDKAPIQEPEAEAESVTEMVEEESPAPETPPFTAQLDDAAEDDTPDDGGGAPKQGLLGRRRRRR